MKYAVAVCLSILLGAPSARAIETAGDTAIEIVITDEIEIKVKNAAGVEELRRVPAEKVAPGMSVIYTLSAKNTSATPVNASARRC